MTPKANIHDTIIFTKPYPGYEGLILSGVVLKDWPQEKCYIVRAEYGLDFVKYSEITQINRK